MRVRLQFHQYKLVLPITPDMKEKTIQQFIDFISKYLQQHFNNNLIVICGLSTVDRFALNASDIVQDVIVNDDIIICMDDQLVLDREIKVYCDRKNPWLSVKRKKQTKSRKRRSSNANVSSNAPVATTSGKPTPFKWAEVGYNTRNKIYVMLGVGSYIKLFLFSVDELKATGFQEKRIGIIEDDTGDWYTMAKFEREEPEKLKRRLSIEGNEEVEEIEEEIVHDEDEIVAAIGLHVKAEGDQMARAEQIIIRLSKDGLLTTDASEVVHLFGTKSGKRPRRRRQAREEDEEEMLPVIKNEVDTTQQQQA